MSIDISVVIPTYRRAGYLCKCLDALRRQDFPRSRMEVIVVTDGPDEQTVAEIHRLTDGALSIRHYALAARRGPAAARNLGWRRAYGLLILFTDDDTLPHPDWVRMMWQAYLAQMAYAVAFTGRVIVPRPARPTDYEKNVAGLETAEFVTASCGCSVEALRAIGGFDESFTMAWREDSDLQFRLLREGIPIVPVDATVLHPVRKACWGVSLREQKKSLFNALLYKKHPGLFRQRIYAQPFWNYYLMILLFAVSAWALAAGAVLPAAVAGGIWLGMTLHFASRRLRDTSRQPAHLAEMVITSMLIPFLSVYWTLYGAVRFKKFFL